MTGDRIKDIDSIQELVEDAENFSQLKQSLPVLQALGVDTDGIEEVFEDANLEKMQKQAYELAEIPDRFNDLFASEGWIIYDSMDMDVAKTAIGKAESDDMDAAEQVLVECHSPDTVERKLQTMYRVEAFRPRMELAEKALEDYAADRYHACIPVVLLLMDGLVQQLHVDVHGEGRGMFCEDADLTAWDSIAAHSEGLERFVELLRKGRKTTRTEEITFPYRHGILHGMDLGYDNEIVAAKCWAALFAVREWAVKAENDELTPPPEESEPTVDEILEQERRIQEIKKQGDQWEPRDIVVGRDVPVTGKPEDFEEGTPEHGLVKFLHWWKKDNYGYMAEVQRTYEGDPENPGLISDQFRNIDLHSFELIEIEDFSPVFTDITVEVDVSRFGGRTIKEKELRVTRMGDDGKSAIPGVDDGTWVLTTRAELLSPEKD
ncbi:hypothetical protein [Natronoglomus mannanivorans]|uniref:Uncharacterized protein n=1 Tax=Natronoglomus mannanivorans TaxID=2979990 RepID=A0AAP3E4C1_9EURY|nr:hypothetical protein [Halobacteria archaeon AArc-xg1-1]